MPTLIRLFPKMKTLLLHERVAVIIKKNEHFKHLRSMLKNLGSLVVRVSCCFLLIYYKKHVFRYFAKHIYILIMFLPFSVLIPIFL